MGLGRRDVLGGIGVGAVAMLSGAPPAAAAEPLASVRKAWVVSQAEAMDWHRLKDSKGPALTGNESWRHYMQFVEDKLKEYGCVDLHRSSWTFKRLVTSLWPDTSRWSLTSNGRPVPVQMYGANCGTTGRDGVTAPMMVWDSAPGAKNDIDGKIVVYRPTPRHATRDAFVHSDYEYKTPFRSWPREGAPVEQREDAIDAISAPVWDELTASSAVLGPIKAAGKPAGLIWAMNLNRACLEGLYTFGVPADYDFPSVYVDAYDGDRVLADARAGKMATIRVEGERVESEAYQLVGYLPGKDYGTDRDVQIQLRTHTDGPSISQEDGAFGLLGVVKYMRNIPQAQRPRTLMIELDCRHYMPGGEGGWRDQDYFVKNPRARDKIVGMIAMEHLGQIEYVADGNEIKPSGRSLPTYLYATNNQRVIDAAYKAAQDNDLPSAIVRCPARLGIRGDSQGPWYGMGSGAQALGLGFGGQGNLDAYWATSGRIDRFDARSFCRQVATFCQLTGFLMTCNLDDVMAPKITGRGRPPSAAGAGSGPGRSE
jgi:hypothetical protein